MLSTELSLYFIAGTHSDSRRCTYEIGGHVCDRSVLSVEVGLCLRVTHLSDAHLRGHILELAVAVHLAGETVQRVICQHQFNDVLPQLLQFSEEGRDMITGLHRCMTGSFTVLTAPFACNAIYRTHRQEPNGSRLGASHSVGTRSRRGCSG